jgi:hypothetical protein
LRVEVEASLGGMDNGAGILLNGALTVVRVGFGSGGEVMEAVVVVV